MSRYVTPAEIRRAGQSRIINHLLRASHLASLKKIVEDPEASDNDKFVAYDFLKNANIAAGGVLPMCQDTGTAIIMGKKGRLIWTEGDDEAGISDSLHRRSNPFRDERSGDPLIFPAWRRKRWCSFQCWCRWR